ncbi:endonuclease/exonuclease/phosphatase family protein [Hymenobacter busanensis]|nr:endonuclease/exonuclease/phosphatase family protein [Hymenobacter busanensis]QHJ07334.1 hypothetical protein GUY19_08585 [Hymenobacter busanensis]
MPYRPSVLLLLTLALASILTLGGCKKLFPDYKTRTAYYLNAVPGAQPDSLLTCVTYNIQLGFRNGQDPWDAAQRGGSAAHLDSLARVLSRVHPDIICLQEVPRNRSNVDTKDLLEQLAARLRMNYAFGAHGHNEPPGVKPARGEWGNAILTRFPIEGIDNRENEYVSVWQRRSILSAELRVGPRRVRVYSLHFQPSEPAARTAAAYFRERAGDTQLILGDFNQTAVPELPPADYTDVLAPTPINRGAIDRIYLSAGRFSTREVGIIPRSENVSDHPATYCRLRLL